MPLFHPKVIKKLLASPLEVPVSHADILRIWAQSIEDGTIYRQKETSLQGTFKDRIVTQILGYQPFSNGAKNYDVSPEFPLAGNRVDLALGTFDPNNESNSQCIAPFELKGAKTKLDSIMAGRNKTPIQQAWEYAMDAKGARWVLVSNYLEIRLYAVGYGRQDYELFDLRTLYEPEHYTRFIGLLSRDNLLGTNTLSLLEQSAKQDKDITDKLYQDYKIIRHNLISNIRQYNPQVEQAPAVSFAQTILDRILFVAFAEDKGLLPESSLKNAFEYKDPYTKRPVWETYKALFRSINEGNLTLKIPKYNGGLFADDHEINALTLPDSIFEGFKKLGDYDFATEVSVNILGHIFEQSISDIEALQQGLPDLSIKTKDGKRKKEGVVYTPPFITRYIVDETLGGYLTRRRNQLLEANPSWIIKSGDRKGEFKAEKAELDFWLAWQDILKNIKIVDPACGSGAFLVAAFDYLHDEYTRVNVRLTELRGTSYFSDPDREILVNNLYGVDLNSESIEITKLSLWLKTAKHGKVLNSLDANFRWGDSLIEDANYSARAFTWKEGFPEIFANGGFDIVLGNPPYVRMELIKPLKPYLEKRYEVTADRIDLYAYFFELGLRILKPQGRMGFICSSTFFKTGSGENLRKYLKANASQDVIIDFGDLQIFEGVTTYPTIMVMTKSKPADNHQIRTLKINEIPNDINQIINSDSQLFTQENLSNSSWQLENKSLADLREKLAAGRKTLKDIYGSPGAGIKTGLNDAFIIDAYAAKKFVSLYNNSAKIIKPIVFGKDVEKWHLKPSGRNIIYIPKSRLNISEFPPLYEHLLRYKAPLDSRAANQKWFELQQAQDRYEKLFLAPKIVYTDISDEPQFSLDVNSNYPDMTMFFIPTGDRFLLALLNSNVSWFFLKGIATFVRGGFLRVKNQFVERIPIPTATDKQKETIGNLAMECQKCAEERYAIQSRVGKRIGDLAHASWDGKLGKALSNWWELDFKAFQNQIKKIFKRDIPIFERDQWETYLSTEREKVYALNQKIESFEQEINAHVYDLFNLTPEEIKLIEGK